METMSHRYLFLSESSLILLILIPIFLFKLFYNFLVQVLFVSLWVIFTIKIVLSLEESSILSASLFLIIIWFSAWLSVPAVIFLDWWYRFKNNF